MVVHSCNPSTKEAEASRVPWLMPVILTIQETEIRRIAVQSQPRQVAYETLFQKYPTQKRASRMTQVVEHCLTSASLVYIRRPCLKREKGKRTSKFS
jgi:hypothetical protein